MTSNTIETKTFAGLYEKIMSENRLKYENCAVKKAIIFSNESDLDVDLTADPDVQYAESIFSDTIEVDVTLSNTVGTVEENINGGSSSGGH